MSKDSLSHIIKVVFLVLFISFILDKIVFHLLNKVSDQVFSGQSIGKLNHYLKVKDELDLIVFGSSRANHHVDPTLLTTPSFNMGVNGKMIAYFATLMKLLPKGKEQIILLHIDPSNAYINYYKAGDLRFLSTKYNRYETIKMETDRMGQQNILQKFYWSLSYNGMILGILKNYFSPNYDYKNYWGYDPIYPSNPQRKIFEEILKTEKEITCQDTLTLDEIHQIYLEEIKLFCDKNNKQLIVFTSPEYNDNCKNDNLQFSALMKKMGFTYYDFSDFFKTNNSISYWKDKLHLSNKGAEIFTQEMKRIIFE